MQKSSMSVSLHIYSEPNTDVANVTFTDDGDCYMDIGEYPNRVTVFMTTEQLNGVRMAIANAQNEQWKHRASDAELALPPSTEPYWHGVSEHSGRRIVAPEYRP